MEKYKKINLMLAVVVTTAAVLGLIPVFKNILSPQRFIPSIISFTRANDEFSIEIENVGEKTGSVERSLKCATKLLPINNIFTSYIRFVFELEKPPGRIPIEQGKSVRISWPVMTSMKKQELYFSVERWGLPYEGKSGEIYDVSTDPYFNPSASFGDSMVHWYLSTSGDETWDGLKAFNNQNPYLIQNSFLYFLKEKRRDSPGPMLTGIHLDFTCGLVTIPRPSGVLRSDEPDLSREALGQFDLSASLSVDGEWHFISKI